MPWPVAVSGACGAASRASVGVAGPPELTGRGAKAQEQSTAATAFSGKQVGAAVPCDLKSDYS
jgi:hypothetical protein|eukprot:6793914-Prymnesium_polylepis.1